jgi:WD40 repeat protein
MISGSPSRTASWWKWNQGDVAPSLLPLPQFEDAVFGVAVSGDGQTAVYSTERHGLRHVNRASISTETQVLLTNRGLVRSLAMDTKGEWLGIGGNDGEFRLIELKRPSASVRGFRGEASVTAVAVSGERGVAAWGNTQGAIRVTTLSNATTNEWHAKDFASLGSNVLVAALALSRDGRLAVSGWTQQRFSLPDPHQPHQKGEVVSMEVHPLFILDLRNGEIVQDLGPLDSWSDCVAFSPSGRYLAVGTISGDVRIWDTTKRNAGWRVIKGHKGSVNAVAWDDQEHWIASMDIFRNFRVSMLERPSESPSASFAGPVLAVTVDQKDMSVLCVSTAGRLNKWDPSTSQMVPLEASAWDTKAAAISRDGRYFALAAGHANPGQGVQVRVRTNDGFQPLGIPDSPAWVESLAFGRSGTLVFGCENEIRYWRPEIAHTKRLAKVEGWVRCLAISEDGLRLVSSSDDGMVRLWRIVEDEPVFDQVIATESSRIRALAINSNYDIAVGLESGQVHFFASDGGQRLELSDHRGAATALAFLGNNAVLASGGEDGTVRIYRLYTGHAPIVLRAESGGVNALAWREKDKCLVAGYSSGRVIAWITDTTKLAEVVCQLVRRDLTAIEWRRYVARDVPYERTCQAEKPMDATASPQ